MRAVVVQTFEGSPFTEGQVIELACAVIPVERKAEDDEAIRRAGVRRRRDP